jgi:hypothetical protein
MEILILFAVLGVSLACNGFMWSRENRWQAKQRAFSERLTNYLRYDGP